MSEILQETIQDPMSKESNEKNIIAEESNEKDFIIEEETEKDPIAEKASEKDQILNQVYSYFKGSLQNEEYTDISYKTWVIPNQNIKYLCNEFIVNFENVQQVFYYHDIQCEMRLIKWLTEDKVHVDNLMKKCEKRLVNPHHNPEAFPLTIDPETVQCYNASFINGPINSMKHLFIASESPTKDSIESFWKMIHNNPTITVIISLKSPLTDDKNNKEKDIGDNLGFCTGSKIDYMTLLITKTSETSLQDFCVIQREYELLDKENNTTRKLTQIVVLKLELNAALPTVMPLTIKTIVHLLKRIEKEANIANGTPKILIHHNEKCNKAGVIIIIFNIAKCLKIQRQDNQEYLYINIFNPVRKLREQRMNMIIDSHQYQFIYDYSLTMLKEYFK